MAISHTPPQARRQISLGDFLLSVLLLGMALGMYRMAGVDRWGQHEPQAPQIMAYIGGSFLFGICVVLPVGRLTPKRRFRMGGLMILGCLAGAAFGCVAPCLLSPFF